MIIFLRHKKKPTVKLTHANILSFHQAEKQPTKSDVIRRLLYLIHRRHQKHSCSVPKGIYFTCCVVSPYILNTLQFSILNFKNSIW